MKETLSGVKYLTLQVAGGKIQIAPDNTVQMTGPAETIYEGETEIC